MEERQSPELGQRKCKVGLKPRVVLKQGSAQRVMGTWDM